MGHLSLPAETPAQSIELQSVLTVLLARFLCKARGGGVLTSVAGFQLEIKQPVDAISHARLVVRLGCQGGRERHSYQDDYSHRGRQMALTSGPHVN